MSCTKSILAAPCPNQDYVLNSCFPLRDLRALSCQLSRGYGSQRPRPVASHLTRRQDSGLFWAGALHLHSASSVHGWELNCGTRTSESKPSCVTLDRKLIPSVPSAFT